MIVSNFTDFSFLQDLSTLSFLLTIIVSATIFAYVIGTEIYRAKVRLSTIPGPIGVPVFGNLLQLKPDPAETLYQWGKRYGGVYQIFLGVRPVVVFTSMQAAKDVFIGKSASLVAKPHF